MFFAVFKSDKNSEKYSPTRQKKIYFNFLIISLLLHGHKMRLVLLTENWLEYDRKFFTTMNLMF